MCLFVLWRPPAGFKATYFVQKINLVLIHYLNVLSRWQMLSCSQSFKVCQMGVKIEFRQIVFFQLSFDKIHQKVLQGKKVLLFKLIKDSYVPQCQTRLKGLCCWYVKYVWLSGYYM